MTQTGTITFGAMEQVIYGRPAADALAEFAAARGADRVFLMASGTLSRETGEIGRVRDALGPRLAGTFAAMPAHSPRSAVIEAANAARDAGADLIATFGGGSITDAAKAVQLCLANDVTTVGEFGRLVPGRDKRTIAPPTIRQISIPTTLSAGEFSAIAGVTNEATKTKEGLRHPGIMPQAVILDPAVTVHTPEWLWLSTGIRAVDHCVEGYCSNEANPFGDAQAIKGLELLVSGLARVQADPGDLDARQDCQIGSWLSMGPLASGVPMGASHGIGYVLGAVFDVPHGHTSCVMLPDVMRWNAPANAKRQHAVARAMGRESEAAGDALDDFIAGLGMPRSLAAVGVPADRIDLIAEKAMATPWVPRNPRPIAGPADVREILEMVAG